MRFIPRKRISELESLYSASVNTFVVGVDNGTTYKIETSAFAEAVISSVSASIDARLDYLEALSGSYNDFSNSYHTDSASFDGRIDTLEQFSASADDRYILSGSIQATTWDTIENKPDDIVSSSQQILDWGYLQTSSFNSFTQSYYTDSSSVDTRLGTLESVVDIDNYATTESFNSLTESFNSFTQSYYSDSSSVDSRLYTLETAVDIDNYATTESFNSLTESFNSFTQSYSTDSSSFDSRIYTLETAVDVDNYATTSSFNSFTQSTNNTIAGLTTTSSFNSFTQSQNQLNATWATTGSNTFKGSQIVSGAIYVSGSLIPNADTSFTSSFSLGSATNAWKDIWVSKGTINFLGDDGSVVSTLKGTPDGLAMANLSVTGSISASSITGSLLSTNGVISSSTQIASYGYAITGSNTFIGNQIISGALYVTSDVIVRGSASIQNITSSQLNIADNIITVNTIQPTVRFGGFAVIDSGSSPQRSGSLLFDSQENQWIYVHQSTPVVTSSLLIMAAETYNNVGNEIHPTTNRLMKSVNDEHIGDSNISDNGTTVSINSNTEVTGSLKVTTSISASTFTGLGNLSSFSASVDSQLTALEIYSASLKNAFSVSGSNTSFIGKVNVSASAIQINAGTQNGGIFVLDTSNTGSSVSSSVSINGYIAANGGNENGTTYTLVVTSFISGEPIRVGMGLSGSGISPNVTITGLPFNGGSSTGTYTLNNQTSSFGSSQSTRVLTAGYFISGSSSITGSLVWDVINNYWKAGVSGSEVQLANVSYVDNAINTISGSITTTIGTLSSSLASRSLTNSQSAWGAFQSASAYSSSFSSSLSVVSSSLSLRIEAVNDNLVTTASFNSFTSSYNTTSASFASRSLINSQSAWGAFTSASAYSSSFSSSLSVVSSSLNTRFNTFSSSINSLIIVQSASLFVTTASFNTFTSSYNTTSASFSSRIDAVNDNLVSTASFNSFTSSYLTDSASFASRSLINSQSAWGAFQSASAYSSSNFQINATQSVNITAASASAWGAFTSASAYSSSLSISIQAVNDNLATTSSNAFSGSQIITGSLVVTGSISSNVVTVTIATSTASLDFSKGNNFTLLLSGSNTRIVGTNIKPGITANLLITTGTNTSVSLAFLQPSGSLYTASLGSGRKDVLSLVSFDTASMYVTATKNFI